MGDMTAVKATVNRNSGDHSVQDADMASKFAF